MMKLFVMPLVFAAALAGPLAAQGVSAIGGSGPMDIWAMGVSGATHFDGRAWTRLQDLPAQTQVSHIAGTSANNLWAIGMSPTGTGSPVLHWDGAQWTTLAPPSATTMFQAIAVSGSNVHLLEMTENESDTMSVHTWNGTAWSRSRLPHALVVAGMHMVGTELWIAGYAYFDPRPDTRNQSGVLLRRVAGRWTSNWNGRRSTDPVIGAASWSNFSVVGSRVMLFGSDSANDNRMIMRSGAAWRQVALPSPPPTGSNYVQRAQLLGDGSPMIAYVGAGYRTNMLVRLNGTSWEPMGATFAPSSVSAPANIDYSSRFWSPSGSDVAFAIANFRTVMMVTPAETRALTGTWCLGASGGGSRLFNTAGDAAVCAAAATAPAAAAPAAAAAPETPGNKNRTPPAGLPRPSRP